MHFAMQGPSIETEQLQALHDFLTARGWRTSPFVDVDEHTGYPSDSEPSWDYPDSFGGTRFYLVDDVTPHPLNCRISSSGSELEIQVTQAGNYYGCEDHGIVEHFVAVDGRDWERLAHLLDALELSARGMDARKLIECRFFGACGQALFESGKSGRPSLIVTVGRPLTEQLPRRGQRCRPARVRCGRFRGCRPARVVRAGRRRSLGR